MNSTHFPAIIALACTALVMPCQAFALDTIEPFGEGASDIELYLGVDGFGRSSELATLGSTLVYGYGFSERFSAYFSWSMESDARMSSLDGTASLGATLLAVDGDVFDLDMLVGLRMQDDFLRVPDLESGVELDASLGRFGLFATTLGVISEPRTTYANGAAIDMALALGFRFAPAEGHEVLAAASGALHIRPADEVPAPPFEIDGFMFGYNTMLGGGIELIHEVRLSPAATADKISVGITSGLLFAVPSS